MALVGYFIVFSFVTKPGQTLEFLLWGTIVPLNSLVGYHCSIVASTPQPTAYASTMLGSTVRAIKRRNALMCLIKCLGLNVIVLNRSDLKSHKDYKCFQSHSWIFSMLCRGSICTTYQQNTPLNYQLQNGHRSSSVAAPRPWNHLPTELLRRILAGLSSSGKLGGRLGEVKTSTLVSRKSRV